MHVLSLHFVFWIHFIWNSTYSFEKLSEGATVLLRTHLRQERSEYTLQNLLEKARHESHTVSALAFSLQIVKGMR